jgi:pimeloyl-ACP methyl ester carboxylesterase
MPTLRWPAARHAPAHPRPVLSALPGGLLGGRYGTAPARVVALHGWRRTHADFDAVLAGLDATAPDLPGFGAAPAPEVTWGSAEYAAAVLPLATEAPPVILVGHSFGAKVAVALAAAHPEVVKALVLTGAPLLRPAGQARPKPSAAHRLARRLNQAGLVSDARMEARRQQAGSEDYRAATGVMRDVLVRSIAEMDGGTYARALPRIGCPVELVWGEHDTAATPAVAQEAAALLPHATITILPGVGHLTPTEAPDALRAAIERHGERHRERHE